MALLTDTKVRLAKAADKDYKLTDERGLHLLVRKSGSKLWQFRYRFDGKEKLASFGPYPEVTLAEARDRREQFRKQVVHGIDPMAARRAAVEAAKPLPTFEDVALQWLAVWQREKSPRHVGYTQRRLEADVFPRIGHRPVAEIQAPEVVQLISAIQSRGAIDLAHRAYQIVSMVFRYAIAHGLATRNPAADIRPSDVLASRKKQNFARVSERELPALLRAIDVYTGEPATRIAVKLLAMTFVRTSELINARWDEFDLERAQWRIPAERMKMKSPHIVPLARQAVELLRTLQTITGHRAFLFPGQRRGDQPIKPISNNTILKALGRMGYAGKMTGHGFRGIASTILHEQGYEHAHIELQLAHQERNEVSAAYNHALYLQPRTQMMQAWADYLDACRNPAASRVAPPTVAAESGAEPSHTPTVG